VTAYDWKKFIVPSGPLKCLLELKKFCLHKNTHSSLFSEFDGVIPLGSSDQLLSNIA